MSVTLRLILALSVLASTYAVGVVVSSVHRHRAAPEPATLELVTVRRTPATKAPETTGHTIVRREGMERPSDWEQDEKPAIMGPGLALEKLTQVAVQIEKTIDVMLNKTEEVLDEVIQVIEHPINELTKTKKGKIMFIVIVLCVSFVALRVALPVLRVFSNGLARLFSALSSIIAWVWRKAVASKCLMLCCAMKPFVATRNQYRRYQIYRHDAASVKLFEPGKKVEMVKRTTSQLHTDENGVYLLADNNHRVYFGKQHQQVLQMSGALNRDKEDSVTTVKEACLAETEFYEQTSMPAFQGQVMNGSQLLGHFSRINFEGKDCLLTAYHVLGNNKAAMITLSRGDKHVLFGGLDVGLVAGSVRSDFLILEVPSHAFATLGIKTGTVATRVHPREPICIYQFHGKERKPVAAYAAIRASTKKPWHINYKASTTVGTSGAPILDISHHIVGVHVEHNRVEGCNVGVIPIVFRNCVKESPTGEDIAAGQPFMERVENEEQFERVKHNGYTVYLSKKDKKRGHWTQILDDIEADNFEYPTWTISAPEDRHFDDAKESPWTCTHCFTVSSDRCYNCENCGYAMVPLDSKKLKKMQLGLGEASAQLSRYLPAELVEKIVDAARNENDRGAAALKVQEMLSGRDTLYTARIAEHGKDIFPTGLYPDIHRINTHTYSPEPVALGKRLSQEVTHAQHNPNCRIVDNHLTAYKVVKDEKKTYRSGEYVHKMVHEPIQEIVVKRLEPETVKESAIATMPPPLDQPVVVVPTAPPPEKSPPSLTPEDVQILINQIQELKALKAKTSETSQVPLNSQAPATTGAPTLSGTKKVNPSQPKAELLAEVTSPSSAAGGEKKPESGKRRKRSTRTVKTTAGPTGAPKPKSGALPCK